MSEPSGYDRQFYADRRALDDLASAGVADVLHGWKRGDQDVYTLSEEPAESLGPQLPWQGAAPVIQQCNKRERSC